MANDELEQLRQRVIELESHIKTLEEQASRDRQLLASQELRLNDLERRLIELEQEPSAAAPLA
jgi:predicted  nucleic acid-binding Zn-ribbon protein